MAHAFLAKALSPPQPEAIDNALETLRLLKALDEEEVCMRFLPLSLKFVCMSRSPPRCGMPRVMFKHPGPGLPHDMCVCITLAGSAAWDV